MINVFKAIFNAIFIAIYVCNIGELIGYRLGQKGKKKEQIGIEIVQIVIISIYTTLLIAKGAF